MSAGTEPVGYVTGKLTLMLPGVKTPVDLGDISLPLTPSRRSNGVAYELRADLEQVVAAVRTAFKWDAS